MFYKLETTVIHDQQELNYHSDHRVRGGVIGSAPPVLFDGDTEINLPTKFEVCPTCEGKGVHVNPSIDAGGLSAQDFAEDPDFAEEYLSGRYDVTCYRCQGERVVPVVDESRLDKETLEKFHKQQQEDEDFRRMQEAERRMGA